MSWCSLVTSTALEDILVNMACTHCYSVKLSRMALAPYPQKWSCETVYEKVNFMFTGYMSVMPATIQLDSLEAIVTLWWYFICRVLDPTQWQIAVSIFIITQVINFLKVMNVSHKSFVWHHQIWNGVIWLERPKFWQHQTISTQFH